MAVYKIIQYLFGCWWVLFLAVVVSFIYETIFKKTYTKTTAFTIAFFSLSSLGAYYHIDSYYVGCIGLCITQYLLCYMSSYSFLIAFHILLSCSLLMICGTKWLYSVSSLFLVITYQALQLLHKATKSLYDLIWKFSTRFYKRYLSAPVTTVQSMQEILQTIQQEPAYRSEVETVHSLDKKTVISQDQEPEYILPNKHLFGPVKSKKEAKAQQELKRQSRLLEEKLALFGIEGSIVSMTQGPVVTLFEYEPAPDCKLSRITALEDDLTLALQALSVRIIAPVPGTACVGFEVASHHREAVTFSDIIHDDQFADNDIKLPLIIGKTSSGEVCIADLTKMPHVLIAGTTGSGKSVGLHSFLMGLLVRHKPEDLRLILIDPKRLELAPYDGIAHLLFPLVTDAQRACKILEWATQEMNRRYELLARYGVRSCLEFHEQGHHMPYIVIIIDELADLVMLGGRAIEEHIARLAQMARAAGIHLIVATQRPSTDVITGLIKVNFPARIAYKVASKIDSRIILDTTGAEKLIGKGDLLFLDSKGTLIRAHGAYVSHAQVLAITNHIRQQQQPQYEDLLEVTAHHEQAEDPLLPDIIVYIQKQEEISISSIQRVFRIGYNRSARIIDALEMRGIIGPCGQGKMRKVISKS